MSSSAEIWTYLLNLNFAFFGWKTEKSRKGKSTDSFLNEVEVGLHLTEVQRRSRGWEFRAWYLKLWTPGTINVLLKASESNYSPSDNTNPKYSTQKPGADTWYSYWVWRATHSCSVKISNIRVIIRDNNTLSTWYLSRSITLTILLSIAQYATIKTIAHRLKTFDNRQTISLKTTEFTMARGTLSQTPQVT